MGVAPESNERSDWLESVVRDELLLDDGSMHRSAKWTLKTVCCWVRPSPRSSVTVLTTLRFTVWPKISLPAARINPAHRPKPVYYTGFAQTERYGSAGLARWYVNGEFNEPGGKELGW